MSPPIGFVPPTSEEIAKVYRHVGTDESSIKEAKGMLLKWLKAQPHLPDTIDDRRLEQLYINSRCSLERSKAALDAYFSTRTSLPRLLQKRDPLRPDLQKMMEVIMCFPMPRLTPEGYRVHIIRFVDPDVFNFDAEVYLKLVLMMLEVRLAEDCVVGEVYVFDIEKLSIAHVTAFGPTGAGNFEHVAKMAYGSHIKGMHFINPNVVMDLLYKIIAIGMSPKLGKTVHSHGKKESLFEHLPAECVPNEMGGSGGPAAEHWESWKKKLTSYRDWFIQQDKYISDESKRPGKNFSVESLLGSQLSLPSLKLF